MRSSVDALTTRVGGCWTEGARCARAGPGLGLCHGIEGELAGPVAGEPQAGIDTGVGVGAWKGEGFAGEGCEGSATSKSPHPSSSSSTAAAGLDGAGVLPHEIGAAGWVWSEGQGCVLMGEAWLVVPKKSNGSLAPVCCDCCGGGGGGGCCC